MWRGEDSGRGADISGRHCRGLPVALFACGRRVGETRAAESLVRYRVNLLSVKDKLRDPYPCQWQLAPRVPLDGYRWQCYGTAQSLATPHSTLWSIIADWRANASLLSIPIT